METTSLAIGWYVMNMLPYSYFSAWPRCRSGMGEERDGIAWLVNKGDVIRRAAVGLRSVDLMGIWQMDAI